MKTATVKAVVTVLLLATVGCNRNGIDESSSQQQPAAPLWEVPIGTTTVKIAAVPVNVTAFGSVAGGPNSSASLSFAEPGRISRVLVIVGDRVARGQALARLDIGPYAADDAQARATVAAARAAYDKAVAGASPQQQAQTTAQLDAARTQLAFENAQLSRQRQLFAAGFTSRANVDTADAAAASSQSQLRVLEQQLSAQMHPWAPDVAAALANLQQAEAAESAAEQRVGYTALTAPFDGVVTARLHTDGEMVDQTMPVILVADARNPVFTADFAPQDARRLHVGDLAHVRGQGADDVSAGRVVAINPSQSNDARAIAVLIRLSDATTAFGPGAFGTASVQIGIRRGMVVPISAIVNDPNTGESQVVRRVQGHFTSVPITVLSRDGSLALINSAILREGDVVVSKGVYELIAPASATKPASD